MSYVSHQEQRYIRRDVKQTDCFRYCVNNHVTVPVCMRSSVIINTLQDSHIVTATREKVSVNNTNLAPHTVLLSVLLLLLPLATTAARISIIIIIIIVITTTTGYQRLLHTKLPLCSLVCVSDANSVYQTSALCSRLYSRGFYLPNFSSVLWSVIQRLLHTKLPLCALVCVSDANSVYQTSALCSRLCYGDFCTPVCSSVLWSVFQRLLHPTTTPRQILCDWNAAGCPFRTHW